MCELSTLSGDRGEDAADGGVSALSLITSTEALSFQVGFSGTLIVGASFGFGYPRFPPLFRIFVAPFLLRSHTGRRRGSRTRRIAPRAGPPLPMRGATKDAPASSQTRSASSDDVCAARSRQADRAPPVRSTTTLILSEEGTFCCSFHLTAGETPLALQRRAVRSFQGAFGPMSDTVPILRQNAAVVAASNTPTTSITRHLGKLNRRNDHILSTLRRFAPAISRAPRYAIPVRIGGACVAPNRGVPRSRRAPPAAG